MIPGSAVAACMIHAFFCFLFAVGRTFLLLSPLASRQSVEEQRFEMWTTVTEDLQVMKARRQRVEVSMYAMRPNLGRRTTAVTGWKATRGTCRDRGVPYIAAYGQSKSDPRPPQTSPYSWDTIQAGST